MDEPVQVWGNEEGRAPIGGFAWFMSRILRVSLGILRNPFVVMILLGLVVATVWVGVHAFLWRVDFVSTWNQESGIVLSVTILVSLGFRVFWLALQYLMDATDMRFHD